ncbi:MAG: hypothetical protein VCE91_00785 [Nitrospinota bacterium]
MDSHKRLLQYALFLGLAAALAVAAPDSGASAAQTKGAVMAKGSGTPIEGSEGAEARNSAFLAAVVHATVKWAKVTQGDRLDWRKDPNSGAIIYRQSLDTKIPSGFRVTSDSWVKNETMVHSVQSLRIPRGKIGNRLPISLIVVDGVLVSPSATLLNPKDLEDALKDDGFSLTSTEFEGGGVIVTLSRASRGPQK